MGKRKVKPFIDKKHSTTYTILPKTQAELALLGEQNDGRDYDDQHPRLQHDDDDKTGNSARNTAAASSSSSFQQWKNQLQRAGIALSDDQLAHRYLKEVKGDGVFVDATSGRTSQLVVDPTTTTTITTSRRATSTTASTEWTQDPVDPNSELLFDNVDLTLDCMDDDMRKILMLGELGDDDAEGLFESGSVVVEELDDDFCLQAAQEPEPDKAGAAFDYDAHIRQLLERARKERDDEYEERNDRRQGHPGMADRDFFAGKIIKSSKARAEGRKDDDDLDESDDDGEYDADDLDDWLMNSSSTQQAAIGSVGAGGAGGGVSSKLRPDEEKALCDKFLETLAEYDNDDDDDEVSNEDDHGHERRGTVDDDEVDEEDINDEEDHEEENDDGESALEDEHGGGGVVGEAELEAAMDDFLRENQDDILVQGRRSDKSGDGNGTKNETGGSGYSVLVGTRMVPASTWNNGDADKDGPDASPDDPPESVADILAEADATLSAPIEILTLDSVITVDEFDGKSYFSERTKNPWDCESILSTYSNLDNNPAVIDHTANARNRQRRKNRITTYQEAATASAPKILLSSKTGLPIRAPHHNAAEEDESHGATTTIGVNRGVARNKNESKEEKRARKMAAKQERQLSQARKKELRNAFGHELQKRAAGATTTDAPVGSAVFRYS